MTNSQSPSDYEKFWQATSFAVIGHSKRMKFPVLTYGGLRELGKTVFPIDSSVAAIEGDRSFSDFAGLPKPVEAVVLELPSEETSEWLDRAVQAGIRQIWIHAGTEDQAGEAILRARSAGAKVLTGTCAVMYVMPRRFPHRFHGWIMRKLGRY